MVTEDCSFHGLYLYYAFGSWYCAIARQHWHVVAFGPHNGIIREINSNVCEEALWAGFTNIIMRHAWRMHSRKRDS